MDISPEWARIARANLRLHEKQGDIREGNALRGIKSDERFERIVMNPLPPAPVLPVVHHPFDTSCCRKLPVRFR
jgi:hypothetical protein